jgi:hypothetical protein
MPTLPETLFGKEIPASKQFIALMNRTACVESAA